MARSTARAYAAGVSVYVLWCHERGYDARQPAVERLSAYLASLSPPRAQNTCCNHLAALKAYSRWLGSDAAEGLRLRRPHLQPRRPFSEDELARLRAACRTARERAMVAILLSTGLRLSELRGLRLEDVGPDGVTRVQGKGSRERYVWLSPAVLALVTRLDGRRATGYIFASYELHTPGRYRGQLPSATSLWEAVARIGRRAGVAGCHPHRFRVTAANRFLQAGGDLGALQVLLGHASPAMTLYYAGFSAQARALEQQRRMALG